MKIEKIADVPKNPYAKIMIFGGSGIGKTLASCIAKKALVVNCEGGLLCLEKYKDYFEMLGLDVCKPESMDDLLDLFVMLKDTDHGYETVILDSLTEIQKMSLEHIMASPKHKGDPDTPSLQDYGINTNQVRKLVRVFRDLPMHVVFTALDIESKDDTDGTLRMMPLLTPKLQEEVMGYMDIVGYLFMSADEDGKPVRKLLTQPTGKYRAKDRSGTLGIGLVNPTMYDITCKLDGTEVPEIVTELKAKLIEDSRK